MEQRIINVYKYEELSESAKEKARDHYRLHAFTDYSDWSLVYETAVTAGNLLGIEFDTRRNSKEPCIWFSGFNSQGDGACFEGSYRYKKGAPKAIKDEFPQDKELLELAERLQAIQRRYFYQLRATCTHRGHYQHSGCMAVDVSQSGDVEDDIAQALREFADWIYDLLSKENDFQTSDETVAENIIGNEYDFNEEGERI